MSAIVIIIYIYIYICECVTFHGVGKKATLQ